VPTPTKSITIAVGILYAPLPLRDTGKFSNEPPFSRVLHAILLHESRAIPHADRSSERRFVLQSAYRFPYWTAGHCPISSLVEDTCLDTRQVEGRPIFRPPARPLACCLTCFITYHDHEAIARSQSASRVEKPQKICGVTVFESMRKSGFHGRRSRQTGPPLRSGPRTRRADR
jgi:hypothetical protein